MREVVLDTETTGLSFVEDRIVEVGMVELVDYVPTGKTLQVYCNPGRPNSPEALRVHGLTDEWLKTKPTFRRQVDKVLRFLGDSPLVAHNSDFDIGMLNAELRRLDRPPLSNPVVNTLVLARQVKRGGLHNLDALCRYYRIDNARRTKHGALLDAEILAEVYLQLRGGRQTALDLVVADETAEAATYAERPSRVPLLTREEAEQHRRFVSSLGGEAIWNSYDASFA